MRLEVDNTPAVIPATSSDHFYQNGSSSDASKEALNVGIKAAQAGDRVNARIALLRATELDDGNENAWLWLASISEYPEELIAFLERVLGINPENERAVQWMSATRALLAKTFLQRGSDAAEAGQAMYAEDCFRKALEYDQKSASAWLWLASLSQEKPQRVEYLQKVLSLDPDNQAAKTALASIFADEEKAEFAEIKKAAFDGDPLGCMATLENFNERYPSNVEAWMLRSHLVSHPADKMNSLRRVLEIDPSHDAAKHSLESLNAMFGVPEPEQFVVEPETVPDGPLQVAEEPETVAEEPVQVAVDAEPVAEAPEQVAVESEEAVKVDEVSCGAEDIGMPIAQPSVELLDEPEKNEVDLSATVMISDEELKEMGVPELWDAPDVEDWNRETETYEFSGVAPENDGFELADAIPMPAEIPVPADDVEPQRTGFETTVQVQASNNDLMTCAFCGYLNDPLAIACSSCLAHVSLSDLESLLANTNADKYMIRKAVEKMEKDCRERPFNEAEYTMLGIGHLNLKNLQFGFDNLSIASKLNASNEVLAAQVRELEARMQQMRVDDEAHAALVKGKTILVVDDSATVRKLIAGKLEKSGHEVFCCSSGEEAMEQLKELTPDLVLLDIQMPNMDGYQVCRQIRGWVATANTPVVMISGKDGSYEKSRAEAAGSTGYITKPFGPETLMKAVEYYLAGGKDLEVLADSVLAN